MLGSNVSPLGKITGLARACLESQLRWFTSVCAASEDGPVVLRNTWKLYLWFLFCYFVFRILPYSHDLHRYGVVSFDSLSFVLSHHRIYSSEPNVS